MGIVTVRNGMANIFDGLKRFTENLEGVDKIAGVVQPLIALIQLQFGAVIPLSVLSIVEDLKSIKAVKNSFMWIGSVNDLLAKPFSVKVFM